jgi:hypothetical protein
MDMNNMDTKERQSEQSKEGERRDKQTQRDRILTVNNGGRTFSM